MNILRNNFAGFSLIELMVTVALISILMAVATPSIVTYRRNAELVSLANSLAASINAARGEAIKRGMYALVKPTDGFYWSTGWVVFVDVNRNNAYDSGTDILVAKSDVPSNTITITANGAAAGIPPYIRFDASGYPKDQSNGFGALSLSISRNDVTSNKAAEETRRLIVASTGRVRVCKPSTDANCTSTELQ